jgi:hypothetical protein
VTTDTWIDTKTGLMLRQHSTTDSNNDSIAGRVTFKEQRDLELRSLVPKR